MNTVLNVLDLICDCGIGHGLERADVTRLPVYRPSGGKTLVEQNEEAHFDTTNKMLIQEYRKELLYNIP